MNRSGVDEPLPAEDAADPYGGVVLVLFAASAVGCAAALAGGAVLAQRGLLNAAIVLGLASGALALVARRGGPHVAPAPVPTSAEPRDEAAGAERDGSDTSESPGAPADARGVAAKLRRLSGRASRFVSDVQDTASARLTLIVIAGGALLLVGLLDLPGRTPLTVTALGGVLAACAAGCGLAATAARYLRGIAPEQLPDAPVLCRGARVVAWTIAAAGTAVAANWLGLVLVARIADGLIVVVAAALCVGLDAETGGERSVPDIAVLSMLGSRPNVVASLLDWAQAQLGIDLRSTWALSVVRRSLEPLLIGLACLGWLSTAWTIVGAEQQGLVERLGVPLGGPALEPGIHLHWPWPIDRVVRVPVRRVQVLTVGHEGEEEEGGPEDVLWARQHAANEYTLLLGNGRDLITVDAAVQFRIADARAWYYQSQNPRDALRAIAYRAVMRTTVNRTLAEALSENLVAMTTRMREMVQVEADALGLGIQVLGFTVGGMHPPVMVAADYQSVVSAELGKVTAVVNAQAYRNRTVPLAETAALMEANAARAEAAGERGRAAGEAWSFLTLQSQYAAAPGDYLFRRRLETLESVLPTRPLAIIDARIQREGGELWLTP